MTQGLGLIVNDKNNSSSSSDNTNNNSRNFEAFCGCCCMGVEGFFGSFPKQGDANKDPKIL